MTASQSPDNEKMSTLMTFDKNLDLLEKHSKLTKEDEISQGKQLLMSNEFENNHNHYITPKAPLNGNLINFQENNSPA